MAGLITETVRRYRARRTAFCARPRHLTIARRCIGDDRYRDGSDRSDRRSARHDQIARDTLVRDALLGLATGTINDLWEPVTTTPTANGIGNRPFDATGHAVDVLRAFEGLPRP